MKLLDLQYLPLERTAKLTALTTRFLRESPQIRQPNFNTISPGDLALLFQLYDAEYFAGYLAQLLTAQASAPLGFRLSSTMTRAGGKTSWTSYSRFLAARKTKYEIAISSRLLFMTFQTDHRPVVVSGCLCGNRLEALQRIMEHEIIHLSELLTWGKSSCSAPQFKRLAAQIFGHTGTKHDLITPREAAVTEHGIKIGSLVAFDFKGRRFVGRVNRIRLRATVLVEAENGIRYTDGKCYHKYLLPVPKLKLFEPTLST